MQTLLQQEFEVPLGEESTGRTTFLCRLRRSTAGTANTALLAIAFVLVAGLLVLLGMRFPEAVSLLMSNQLEIRELQEQNANLRKRRDERIERLKRFNENRQEQRLEIQRQYNLYPKGTKVFVLPPSQPAAQPDNHAPAPASGTPAPLNPAKPLAP